MLVAGATCQELLRQLASVVDGGAFSRRRFFAKPLAGLKRAQWQWTKKCHACIDDWHCHERFPTLAVFGCFEMLQGQC
jgi:hypothetical protein